MMKHRSNISLTLAALMLATASYAADDDIKELQGISIRGDKEAPRSLYIVPWQNTELEQATSLSANLGENTWQALDRDTFKQQLRLHELSKSGWYRLTPEQP
ncbi:MAG: hypothetical protein JSW45_03820 [Thiotrichales bacterium]|nr:MAG: hypothetical protein JSW45_03820 [Thiotrichales bacterium]